SVGQELRGFAVDVGTAPPPVNGDEVVVYALQDIGQALARFVQACFALAQRLFRRQPLARLPLQGGDGRRELTGPFTDARLQLLVDFSKRGFRAPPVVRYPADENGTDD